MRQLAGLVSAAVLFSSCPALAAEISQASDGGGATLVIAGQTLPLVAFDVGADMTAAEYHNTSQQGVQARSLWNVKHGNATVTVTPAALVSLAALAGNSEQTWDIQLVSFDWTLTGARIVSVDTPKVSGPSTVHIAYESITTGNASATLPASPPDQATVYADKLTFDGGYAGFSSVKSSGNGPVTITLLRGITSSNILAAHERQQDVFEADLTADGVTQHIHNARITKFTAPGLSGNSTGDTAIEQLVLVADSLGVQGSHMAMMRTDASAFTTAVNPHDSDGCKDGTLPRLTTYYLNDCDPAVADTYDFAADTGASQKVSGTKLRLAYAINENATVPDAQAVLDDYAALLKQRGWTITHQDNLSITAHTTDARWAEISVNGGGNYQIVYVTP